MSNREPTPPSLPILYWRRHPEISLGDALKDSAALLADAIALVYSPTACCFAKSEDGRLINAAQRPILLDDIFEARVFNPTYELRWLKSAHPVGEAVILAEQDISAPAGWQFVESLSCLAKEAQQYLLWGEGLHSDLSQGWGTLATARIGRLPIPLANLKPHQRVALKTCEYFQVHDQFGNVVVAEERLIKLEVG
jgi:CRISPR-associated protein (TIGR03984 family)